MRYAKITERLAGLGSGKWQIHVEARAMAARGEPIIELTIGEPDIAPDSRLIDACEAALRAGRIRYSNGRGEPAVVSAVAAKYARRRPGIDAHNVLCFPGTQTALFAAMLALVEPGDAVLVGDPLYATYEGVIAATGARMIPVPLTAAHGFRMQADDLARAVTPDCRVLLLNSPHNPTGAVLSADEIAAIGEICRRNDLWIISDEVYEELIFDGGFASPFDRPELAERSIVVSSISKSHAAPGLRSGWAVGPKEFCDRLLPVSETMLFGLPPFIADTTALALAETFDTAALMRSAYQRRARLVMAGLAGVSALRPLMPQAGMFILVDVSGTGLSGADFAWRLLKEAGVAVMPGASFGAQAERYIRVSLTVAEEKLAAAVERMAGLARGMAGAAA